MPEEPLLFSVAKCAVSYVFSDILIHAFTVVLTFYQTVCTSSSLVTKFVMCFQKHCFFHALDMTRAKKFWLESVTLL